MYQLINLLENCKIIKEFEILRFVDEKDIEIFEAKTKLINGSILYIREVNLENKSKYSYHWQTKLGKLIIRWDNSPLHRNIGTFPHHKHIGSQNNIKPSYETNLEQIVRVISDKI